MEGLLVQVHLPQIKEGVVPRKRFMSAFEQKKEAPNKHYQYLIVRFFFFFISDPFVPCTHGMAWHGRSEYELNSSTGCCGALRNYCLPNTRPGDTRRDR